jgi:hypothetical protein
MHRLRQPRRLGWLPCRQERVCRSQHVVTLKQQPCRRLRRNRQCRKQIGRRALPLIAGRQQQV